MEKVATPGGGKSTTRSTSWGGKAKRRCAQSVNDANASTTKRQIDNSQPPRLVSTSNTGFLELSPKTLVLATGQEGDPITADRCVVSRSACGNCKTELPIGGLLLRIVAFLPNVESMDEPDPVPSITLRCRDACGAGLMMRVMLPMDRDAKTPRRLTILQQPETRSRWCCCSTTKPSFSKAGKKRPRGYSEAGDSRIVVMDTHEWSQVYSSGWITETASITDNSRHV